MYILYRIAACFLWMLLPLNGYALEATIARTEMPMPLSALTIDTTKHSANFHYNIYENAPLTPYIGVGDADGDDDTSPDERFWQSHSYQSLQQDRNATQQWAGLKLRLHNILRLSIDTNTRKVTSTMALAPKTNVKVRANFKEIRAELRYQF
jgi:hypothetical protein